MLTSHNIFVHVSIQIWALKGFLPTQDTLNIIYIWQSQTVTSTLALLSLDLQYDNFILFLSLSFLRPYSGLLSAWMCGCRYMKCWFSAQNKEFSWHFSVLHNETRPHNSSEGGNWLSNSDPSLSVNHFRFLRSNVVKFPFVFHNLRGRAWRKGGEGRGVCLRERGRNTNTNWGRRCRRRTWRRILSWFLHFVLNAELWR